jgi:hypothetical protein
MSLWRLAWCGVKHAVPGGVSRRILRILSRMVRSIWPGMIICKPERHGGWNAPKRA